MHQLYFPSWLEKLTTSIFIVVSFMSFGQFELKETRIDSLSISFPLGRYEVTDSKELKAKLSKLDSLSNYKIKLTGYTDTTGTLESNNILARKRYLEVKNLIQRINSSISIDTLNMNEIRTNFNIDDSKMRKVDIVIYKLEYNLEFDKPLLLNVNFKNLSSTLTQGCMPILESIRDILKANLDLKIELHGHVCCNVDTQDLSTQRAEKVKTYLVGQGILATRIVCFGHGNKQPKVDEVDEKSEAINRRVEIVFKK